MSAPVKKIEISAVDIDDCSSDETLVRAFELAETLHPQYGLDWLKNLCGYALDSGERGVVYTARTDAGDFVAVPLKISEKTRQAQSLGTFYTSLYSPVTLGEDSEKLLVALFHHLVHGAGITALILSPLDTNTPLFACLKKTMAEAGLKAVHDFFCFANWTHSLPETDFNSYLEARPSKLQNTIRRRTRTFLADDRGTLGIVTGGTDLESALKQFTAVYNNSWKQEEPYPEFIPQLLRLAANRGWLRLGIARYDDTPVAGQVWLVSGGTAYIFKLAYDENFRQLSPGTVLTTFMMEQVINNDGVSRLDYLSGDDEYKRDWMTQRHLRCGLAGYNPHTLQGTIMALVHTLKTAVKGGGRA